jgi:hypothetical protein
LIPDLASGGRIVLLAAWSMNPSPDSSQIPSSEQAIVGAWLRLSGAWTSSGQWLRTFVRESNRLIDMMDDVDVDYASQRGSIPRLFGLDSAACNWSLYMILDHLARSDREMLTVIRQLKQGRDPFPDFSLDRCVPDPDADSGALERFEASAREFGKAVLEMFPLPTEPRHAHPWYGSVGARGWLAIAAAHHRLHRRHARKTMAVLGVT